MDSTGSADSQEELFVALRAAQRSLPLRVASRARSQRFTDGRLDGERDFRPGRSRARGQRRS